MTGERFYGARGLNVETYDALHESHMKKGRIPGLEGDVEFFTELAVKRGGPALELACGTGRVAWPVATAGVETVGLDLSEPMLEAARAKAGSFDEETHRRIEFVRGDMTDFDLGRKFRTVIIAFRSFQSLLTPDDERRCLECVRRHLEPGGVLAIDNFDPLLEYCVPGAPPPVIDRDGFAHPATGNRVKIDVVERTTDPYTQTIEEKWRFVESGGSGETVREEIETLRLRWIYRHEMRYLLELAGFEIEAEYSDFRKSPPVYGKEQIWIARRG